MIFTLRWSGAKGDFVTVVKLDTELRHLSQGQTVGTITVMYKMRFW